jgi:malic enzyme
MRRVAQAIAEAVVRQAREDGVAGRRLSDAQIPAAVAAAMWNPEYPRVVAVREAVSVTAETVAR